IMANDFRDYGIPLIRISGMKGNIVSLDGCDFLDPMMVEEKWRHFRLDKGDILISSSASTGIVAIVDEDTVGSVPYTGLIRFKPSSKLLGKYLILFISSDCYLEQINIQKTGSTIQHYGPTHLGKVKLLLPPISEQFEIAAYIDKKCTAIDVVIDKKETLIEKLTEYKKSLIYECVTGKREV
ncbi:MAG TPA: restriction endonuclease subunit S, partial [Sedimentibacter sp.]|nr:restriction endonuclease subunit S [Sedimentibacter sp.]